jgi:hypothetical protein
LGVLIAEECSWDKFLPDFEEIVRIAQTLADIPQSQRPLFVGTGVVTPLVLAAFRSRNRKVRQQAISLLYSCEQREGLWDSDVAAEAAEWIVGVEEAGADEKGWIPEGSRVRLSNIAMDAQNRKVHL